MLPESTKGKKQIHKWWKLSPVNPYDSVFLHSKKIMAGIILLVLVIAAWVYYQDNAALRAIEGSQKITNINPPPPPPPVFVTPVFFYRQVPLESVFATPVFFYCSTLAIPASCYN